MKDWFGPRQKQSLFVLVFMLAGIAYMTCRNERQDSPEAKVRAIVQELVSAAESKDLGPFKKYLSEQVTDESGRKRDELLNVMRGIFFSHKKISLTLVSLDIATNTNPNLIDARVVVLMSETLLPTEKGDFLVGFRKEAAGWRIWEVKWGEGYGID